MKSLNKIQIALNKNAEVVLLTDIDMRSDNDPDTLFLNFFTILAEPLRLSILGVGCLSSKLATLIGSDEEGINNLLINSPEIYTNMLQQKTQQLLVESSEEYAKILLDEEKNAKNVRAILTSLLSNGFYKQIVHYNFPSGIKKEEQIVEITDMKPAFKQMLEIVKRYDDEEYLKQIMGE
jgi:hypothetical protein